jgi:hypothetical protein
VRGELSKVDQTVKKNLNEKNNNLNPLKI